MSSEEQPPEGTATEEQPSSCRGQFNKSSVFDKVVNEVCGLSSIEDYEYAHIDRYFNTNNSKKTKTGFQAKTRNGITINWLKDQQGHQMIQRPVGFRKKFTDEDAAAMVALAKGLGWTKMSVHGSVEQKDMLWLAVQLRNLEDKAAFDASIKAGLENGTIKQIDEAGKPPRFVNKDNQPVAFTETVVVNHTPLADSNAMQKLQQAQADYAAGREGPTLKTEEPSQFAGPPPPAAEKTEPPSPSGKKKTNAGPTVH